MASRLYVAAVIAATGQDIDRPVQLLPYDQARELVGKGERAQGKRFVSGFDKVTVQASVPTDHEDDMGHGGAFPALQAAGKLSTGEELAALVHRNCTAASRQPLSGTFRLDHERTNRTVGRGGRRT